MRRRGSTDCHSELTQLRWIDMGPLFEALLFSRGGRSPGLMLDNPPTAT
jgi:hypothetical protein